MTTTLAVASMDSYLLAQESMSTGKDPHEFIARLSRRISDLIRAHPKSSYEGIGISVPGRVDVTSQRLTFAPNLEWIDVDLKTPLERATVESDLNERSRLAGLAEVNRILHPTVALHLARLEKEIVRSGLRGDTKVFEIGGLMKAFDALHKLSQESK